MRKRLIEKFTKSKEGSFGYTMTELLVVVAIIAIVAAITIPSVIAISRALKFKRVNDHAKSIFLAAQQNLTEMRSDGGLTPLQVSNANSLPVKEGQSGFPAEHWSDEYVYTASDLPVAGEQRNTYDIVLPVGSIEAQVRGAQVIIEYNPITGNVYSVFYSEEDESILSAYQSATGLPRDDKDARKVMMLGYYDGSGLSSSELELEKTAAEVVFSNEEEGIVTVKVPIPSLYYDKHVEFREGLEVNLTLTGENKGGTVNINIKESGTLPENCTLDIDGKTVLITFAIDSLRDFGSFANLSTVTTGADVTDDDEAQTAVIAASKHITELKLTDFKQDTNLSDGDTGNILPGDNITIDAYVDFVNTGNNPAVTIEQGTLASVNPMFEYLEASATDPDKYILAVSNGRNLQNLNAIHPEIAGKVESVIFTSDIYWNRTVEYYNEEHGEIPQNGTVKTYQNSAVEAPARSLPYFVPIHNAQLFGTARFEYYQEGEDIWDLIQSGLQGIFGGSFNFNRNVPTLTDGADTGAHATISGYNSVNAAKNNVARVYYLNIDATKYTVPTSTYYAAHGQTVGADYYDFAGLFGYVNTTINNLEVVSPIVKGKPVGNNNNPAAGALFGAAGYNTLVTNCGVYIDTKDADFSRAAMVQSAYNPDANQTWYGVSGEGAVGGLGGYAKSHRTVSGKLTNDPKHLAFSGCFAAVNVSGNMYEKNADILYGYANGVGGFIGNSELTNFYNCYASGNVIGNGYYVIGNYNEDWYQYLNLYHSGSESYGVGGFVGTSHGTRYTNCFATGDVNATGTTATKYSGAGGFVGVMTYDEDTAYGHQSRVAVDQHTVFENCYAVGLCTAGNGYIENFSGANARGERIDYSILKAWNTGDYYKLLAPHYLFYGNLPGYETYYIFKDSYYLSQYGDEASQDNSNKCSNTASYDTLANLHNLYNSKDWISGENGQIDTLKGYTVGTEVIKIVLTDWSTWWDAITNPHYELYFNAAERRKIDLVGIYEHEYMGCNASGFCGGTCTPIEKGGFPEDEWHSATAATTHSYALNGAGSVYPFSKLVGMDYYGDWPSKPLGGGLAYYETYADDTNGFYFDREVTSTLRNDKTIISDGYAILSSSAGAITVSINDKASFVVNASTNAVSLGSVNRPGANSYHVAYLDEATVKKYINDTEFFNKIEASIPGKDEKGNPIYSTYTMYFNPNVALTQVNPTYGTAATKPGSVDDIYIRTARQFANIGTMENFWTKDYNYVQLLDIDSTDYHWMVNGVATTNVNKETSPIGTEAKPFNGTYTSTGAYVTKPALAGFKPGKTDDNAVHGLFGVVGTTGQISDLNVAVKAETLAGSTTDGAILAAVNKGTISNVTVTVNGAGTLKLQTAPAKDAPKNAQANVGLLIGRMEGTAAAPAKVENCSVVTQSKIELTGDNAGGVVGSAQNAVITGSYATLATGFEATADCAGGFAGKLTNCKVTGSKQVDEVTIAGMSATAEYIGGFAGAVSGGTVTSVNAKVNGNVTGNTPAAAEGKTVKGYVAGFAGNADKEAVFAEANVNVVGKISGENAAGISGENAAGIFGKLTDVTVSNTNATISGTIEGKDSAAGFAAIVATSSNQKKEIAASGVTLTGKISASEGRAAGFAVDFGGYANGVGVKLGTYTAAKVAAKSEISGKTEAAGFACTVTGEVGGASVAGAVQIKADKAAGFAIASEGAGRIAASYVTPAHSNTAENYLDNKNENLTIEGTTAAAGFVLDVAKGSTSTAGVYNCYALGNVTGGVPYGFVGNNAGNIDGCTSNVTISGGYAFVGSNTGSILNCYGWYGDGKEAANTTVKLDSGSFTSCYFVDMDIQELEENQITNVVLYTKKGVCKDIATSDLAENGILSELNGDTVKWFSSGTFDAYPYRTMNPASYRFPMLRAHYGNWITPPQYAYGIGYYEIYADGEKVSYSYRLVDVTDPVITVEDVLLSKAEGKFDNSKPIQDYGYFVFCKTGKNPFGEGLVGEEFNLIPTSIINPTKQDADGNVVEVKRYTFYRLNAVEDLTVEGYTVVPYYGNAIHESDATDVVYELRTEEHLDNIGKKPAATFSQTHDIAATDFATVDTFSGTLTAANNAVITVADGSKSWMTNVSRTVDVDLTKVGAVTAPVFGKVTGSVTLGNIEILSIGENGALVDEVAGTVNTGAITVGTYSEDKLIPGAVTKLFGNVTNVTVNGAIETGTVSGQLFGNVSGTGVTVHGNIHTGDIKQIFGTLGAPVEVKGLISTGDLTGNAIGAVSANLTLNGITVGNVPAEKYVIAGITSGTVSTGAVSVKTVNGQVFGSISVDTVTVDSVTTNGHDINGNIFGNVGTSLTVTNGITTSDGKETPTYGAVNGQVFGDITLAEGKTVKVGGITVGNIASGKSVIASIGVTSANAGTVQTGAVSTQMVGSATTTTEGEGESATTNTTINPANIFGDINGGTVTITNGITTGAVNGNVFGNITSGTTVTTGNITVASLSGKLAGSVDGTLTGTADSTKATISLGTNVNLGNLVTSVSGTLQNYSVEGVSSISANVIPAVSEVMVGTVQNFTVTTAGTMSAPLVGGELTGTLNNVTVDVATASVGTNSGILVNSVGSGASVIGCKVEADTASSEAATFGGLTGSNAGTLTNNTVVLGTLNTDGNVTGGLAVGSKNTTVGGLVGKNTGKIGAVDEKGNVTADNTSVTAYITYTPGSSVTIGGLIGENSGTINGATVAGAINLASGTGEGKSYIIGGAVGYDKGGAYTGVTSSVAVDGAWANSDSISGTQDPAGKGPVGMFVGYVTSGDFNTCESTDDTNTAYQFLGQVQVSTATLPETGEGQTWFGHATRYEDASYDQEDDVDENTNLVEFAAAEGYTPKSTYVVCAADLEDCTFYLSNVQYTQELAPTEYFHLGEKVTEEGGWNKIPAVLTVTGWDEGTYLRYSDLYSGTTSVEDYATEFYYLNTNEEYLPVTVSVTVTNSSGGNNRPGGGNSTTYTYVIKTNGQTIMTISNVRNRYDYVHSNDEYLYLYRQEKELPAGTYMITDTSSKRYFDGTTSGVAITSNDKGYMTNVSPALWTTDANGYWKHGDLYLYLRSNYGQNYLTRDEGYKIEVREYNGNFALHGRNRYLSASGNGFGLSEAPVYVSLWTLTEVPPEYSCVFDYSTNKLHSVACVGVDADGNVLPAATALSEETEIPAEEIGGETGNNT